MTSFSCSSPESVLKKTWQWLHTLWGGKDIIVVAPYLDRFYCRLKQQLDAVGAHTIGAICFNADRESSEIFGPFFEASEECEYLSLRMFENMISEPPSQLQTWLAKVDPEAKAQILASPFVGVGELCGRPVSGWRRPEWGKWEDKTYSHVELSSRGIRTAAGVVVHATSPDLIRLAAAIDAKHGVVVAVDDPLGDRGGASMLRYVPDVRNINVAIREFQGQSLRITEYIPGIPASVPGVVSSTDVQLYDPIEIVSLVDLAVCRFIFCGTSTFWNPGRKTLSDMVAIGRKVGDIIRENSDFRGEFSVDGVVRGEEFFVTEINARHPSGIGIRNAWPEFPVELVTRSLGEPGNIELGLDLFDYVSAVRQRIRARPSWSILIPCDANVLEEIDGDWLDLGVFCCKFVASEKKSRVRVLDVKPLPEHSSLGVIVAALATSLGCQNVFHPAKMQLHDLHQRLLWCP